ncbi:MAG: hypothetical protein ACYTFW_08045 [Planctomycetota bacterium]|jgi:hypothetical protein
MAKTNKLRFVLAVLILSGLGGCVGVGPGTVNRDRFAYTDAISESWKRQMLLNLVKMRYADAPIFLDVASVINQYALEAELSGNMGWNQFLDTDSQLIGGRGRYSDRPTITYQPLSGEKFTRSLMTPIPPSSVLSLVQAGWRADAVSWICIQAINGIYNRSGAAMNAHPADPDFYEFVTLFRKVQESRAMGMRIQKTTDKKQSNVLFFRKKDISPETVAQTRRLRELLDLDPEAQELTVVYGSLPQNNREVAILTRSMLEIMVEIASYIEVPAAHVAEGRTITTSTGEVETTSVVIPRTRIRSALEKPADAFVAVQYRGYWFWINDRDFVSKRLFSFLMFLFTLAETGAPTQAPTLTIPTG